MKAPQSLTYERSFAGHPSEDGTADNGKWFYSEKGRRLTLPSCHEMVTEIHHARKAALLLCCMQFFLETSKLSVFWLMDLLTSMKLRRTAYLPLC
jgi:hypothetical protein